MRNHYYGRYRCPYCGEPAFSTIEKMGFSLFAWWRSWYKERIQCPHCRRYCARELWKWGRQGRQWILGILPWVLATVILYVADKNFTVAVCLWGALLVLYVLCNVLFEHFDKFTQEEQNADARISLFVSAERLPQTKMWNIYLLRLPKRGTNASAPVMYGMVCDKVRQTGGYALDMRVIRADNMGLPDIDEPVWLITNSGNTIEGKVTAAKP